MRIRIKDIEVDNIFFRYAVGLTHTAIWTKNKGQWSDVIPDHYKMSFAVDTPKIFDSPHREDEGSAAIAALIRKKAGQQKRARKHVKMTIEARKPRVRKSQRQKESAEK